MFCCNIARPVCRDGIPTDVIKKYPDRLADDVTGPNAFETRPVACGVQITRSGFLGAHQYKGTTTCYVHLKGVDNVAYLLSAAHVLDPKLKDTSYVPYDDIVYQPYSRKRIGLDRLCG